MSQLYTCRQIMSARKARDLHHSLEAPSIQDVKTIVIQNLIKDNLITIQDVYLASQIFGSEIPTIKGKSTRQKPRPAMNNIIKLPNE